MPLRKVKSDNLNDFFKKYRIWIAAVVLAAAWLGLSYFVYVFESASDRGNIRSYPEALWWGVVTFLTIGYGDHYPVTWAGRGLAGLLMMCGVSAIGILTAKISAIFLSEVLLEGRMKVDTDKLKDHFIVLGWKEDMHELLLHILDSNPLLKSEQLLLVANISRSMIEALRGDERLAGLRVLVGDYFQQSTLERAAPDRAQKVLILADKTPGPGGQKPNPMEADAQTIMAAITLSSIARGTMVAAEIIDSKLDSYLKMAGVSEIIYSRAYSRLMLGNASSGTGIVNVIHGLLDPNHPEHIFIPPVPEDYLMKPFREFKVYYESSHPSAMVLGILENSGNPHRLKELALREAQKTPNMARLVENLTSVKNMRWNKPVFNPGQDYLIPKGASAIVIRSSPEAAA